MRHDKTLFVWFVPFDGITNGGGKVNKAVSDIAKRVLGEDNFSSYFVCPDIIENTITMRLKAAFMSTFGLFNGLTQKNIRDIVRIGMRYKRVFLTSSLMGVVAEALRAEGYKGEIIVLFHNVESHYFSVITSKKRPDRLFKIRQAERNEALCCKYADKKIAFNKRDAAMIYDRYHKKVDYIWPLSIRDTFDPKMPDYNAMVAKDRLRCLFVGSNFKANNDAIVWFVREVMPKVNIHLTIVGKDISHLSTLFVSNSDIEIFDSVPQMAPYYYEADVIVSPIMTGSGMKTKTCEALMFGKNIIGTKESFEGYDIDISKVGACCNTAEDFINAINGFTATPRYRHNAYSREVYERKFSINASINLFEKILSM